MRVIAGGAKGRTLFAPIGAATRPTSDLVRGAVLNMLAAAGADFSRALDLYAGSGAMGIEVLSRGEGTCDFVEREPRGCEAIRRNLRLAGVEGRARVLCMPAREALGKLPGPYSLILADPPYADSDARLLLSSWATAGRID